MKNKPAPRNALYAQSGGVSAVINATACGVIQAAFKARRHIGKIYAGRDGIVGVLTEDLIDLSRESAATIRGLRYTPAGAFGSESQGYGRARPRVPALHPLNGHCQRPTAGRTRYPTCGAFM